MPIRYVPEHYVERAPHLSLRLEPDGTPSALVLSSTPTHTTLERAGVYRYLGFLERLPHHQWKFVGAD